MWNTYEKKYANCKPVLNKHTYTHGGPKKVAPLGRFPVSRLRPNRLSWNLSWVQHVLHGCANNFQLCFPVAHLRRFAPGSCPKIGVDARTDPLCPAAEIRVAVWVELSRLMHLDKRSQINGPHEGRAKKFSAHLCKTCWSIIKFKLNFKTIGLAEVEKRENATRGPLFLAHTVLCPNSTTTMWYPSLPLPQNVS